MNFSLKYIFILVICLQIYSLFVQNSVSITNEEKAILKLETKPIATKVNNNYTASQTHSDAGYQIIYPNSPIELSYKTKKEIYDIRKKYVQKSIFASPNYEPSEAVFGQIEDGKPWISMKMCLYEATRKGDIQGTSEESRFIVNPAVLVAPEYAFWAEYCTPNKQVYKGCEEVPSLIKYNKEKKELIVQYTKLMYCNNNKSSWFDLNGLNARDLGYKYVFVDKEKSTLDFQFVENVNASNMVHEFQNYIHFGGACGIKGGCNNGSPNQPPLNFIQPCFKRSGNYVNNKMIYIKLWKERPASPQQEPDMVEKLVFTYSWHDN